MNNYLTQQRPKPTRTLPAYRVGEKAFDSEWNELKVTHKNGWRYLKRGDKHIGLNKLQDKEGYSEPIYFNYLFGGGFMNEESNYYDNLIKNP